MSEAFKIQVPKKYYFDDYDNLKRFITYFYQIDLSVALKPQKILEIGVGNKTVSNYLKQHGFEVVTCDFDKNLEPDYIADIRELPFGDNSFDLVLACEILEHIPWPDAERALAQLHRVTKKHVVISIYYSAICFEAIVKIPLASKILKTPFIDLCLMVPRFYSKTTSSKQHYWEIGRKGYSLQKVRAAIKKKFKIIKEVKPLFNHYRHFFVLEKI